MRPFAIIFGIIFLVIGIGGFIPSFVSENHLFATFRVNIWLNILHTASGLIGLGVGFGTIRASTLYFQIIGIVYSILAILGFIYGDKAIFGIFASNDPNTWIHVILAVAALILGFGGRE